MTIIVTCQYMSLANESVPQFMTLKEVASRLRVSRRTINRYLVRKDNPLPVVYLSTHKPRVPWDQFEIWIDSMQENEKV